MALRSVTMHPITITSTPIMIGQTNMDYTMKVQGEDANNAPGQQRMGANGECLSARSGCHGAERER